jgi:hypothetical protein
MGCENLRYLASQSRSDDLLNPKPTKRRGFVVSLNYKLNQIHLTILFVYFVLLGSHGAFSY